MRSCFSCHSMLFQNTFLKVLRHNLQEQLAKDATGCLTDLQSRKWEERKRGEKKGKGKKKVFWAALWDQREGGVPAQDVPGSCSPARTLACSEQVCAALVINIPCCKSPGCPEVPAQVNRALTRGECRLLNPRSAPLCPVTSSTISEHVLLQPSLLSPGMHLPPCTAAARWQQTALWSKHTSLCCLNIPALSVHHVLHHLGFSFSSWQTKHHCSDRIWRILHTNEVNCSSTMFTEEEKSSSKIGGFLCICCTWNNVLNCRRKND